jgi:hypothetical protein
VVLEEWECGELKTTKYSEGILMRRAPGWSLSECAWAGIQRFHSCLLQFQEMPVRRG